MACTAQPGPLARPALAAPASSCACPGCDEQPDDKHLCSGALWDHRLVETRHTAHVMARQTHGTRSTQFACRTPA